MSQVTRFGLLGTELNGIFFTESLAPPGTQVLRAIHIQKSRQNLNLGVIKELMADEARHAGANAIVGFRYGQRAHKWWQQAFTFKWDTESWHGEGQAVFLQGDPSS